MEKYISIKELGDGTSGVVYKAYNLETMDHVAIKKMKRKFYFSEPCCNLREIKALRNLNHPNIIKLKEVVVENHELFFVFEYMEYNLYQMTEAMKGRNDFFNEEEIRNFMIQLLQGLDHMHKSGYFHRDLKPENLLVTDNVLKIADFGLAREVTSGPPYTDYVATRWYRAPEVLAHSQSYSPAIDMWAVGAILAELFTLTPIFPGESEADQMRKISSVLYPEETARGNLWRVIPHASSLAIDLILRLCCLDESRRPTAEEALQHPFFHSVSPFTLEYPMQSLRNQTVEEQPELELHLHNLGYAPDDCFLGLSLGLGPSFPDAAFQASAQTRQEILFFPELGEHSRQSANVVVEDIPLELSLQTSHLANRCSHVPLPTIGAPQTSGFTNIYPNLLDSFRPEINFFQ